MKRRLSLLLALFYLLNVAPVVVVSQTLMGSNYSRCEQILLEMTRQSRKISELQEEVAKYEAKVKRYERIISVSLPSHNVDFYRYLLARAQAKLGKAEEKLNNAVAVYLVLHADLAECRRREEERRQRFTNPDSDDPQDQ